jgi:tetratricopeptide (TPR) repeat protein
VFYAESWALTHYLEFLDFKEHANHIGTYVGLVNQNEDPVRAAAEAFGDLKQLQMDLASYIGNQRYMFFHMNSAAAPIDPNALQVTPLTQPQADALRADFLAYSGRIDDARALLDTVLKADPNNEPAQETMGFIELRAGHRDEAKKWYGEAVAMDPQSYLAQFHLGSVEEMGGDTSDAVEASLRTAIKLNPRFAPAYDGLATLYGRRREKLDEAHMLELQAMQLEPANVNYRLNVANVLTEQQRYDDAMRVLKAAEEVARTPLEVDVVRRVMKQVEQNKAQMEQLKQQQATVQVHTTVIPQAPDGSGSGAVGSEQPAIPKHPTETPHGPDLWAQGVIRGVHCNGPGVLELKVEGAKGSVSLYSNDAYKIDYRALDFTPKGEIHPCQDLEGMKARVHYFATADKTVDGQITIIALSK